MGEGLYIWLSLVSVTWGGHIRAISVADPLPRHFNTLYYTSVPLSALIIFIIGIILIVNIVIRSKAVPKCL